MKRKLFCELSPFTYRLSMEKEILKRHVQDLLHKTQFAVERTEASFPVFSSGALLKEKVTRRA